uniref:Uncharacterized protein n=1 Tax=Meloidogyne enterolobii TaxID=390850 RepID=A0A6V7TKL7_MELEN|nr:unnamed protein product [Meloidogyne enterolobii]
MVNYFYPLLLYPLFLGSTLLFTVFDKKYGTYILSKVEMEEMRDEERITRDERRW